MAFCAYIFRYQPIFSRSSHNYLLSYYLGTDQTIPYSTGDLRNDKRIPLRNFPAYYEEFIESPNLIHWFAENKDTNHPKLSSLPTGMSIPDYSDEFYAHNIPVPHSIPILDRPLKVLVSDRVRDGSGQWKDRNDVATLCPHVSYCVQPNAGFHKEAGTDYLTTCFLFSYLLILF